MLSIAAYASTPWSVYPTTPVFAPESVGEDLLRRHELERSQAERRGQNLSEAFAKKNAKMFKAMNLRSREGQGIDAVQALELHRALHSNPVVSFKGSLKYDTYNGKVGYCFGRAAFVHLELLRRGVSPTDLGKVFAIGKLYYRGAFWDYHVSTVVKSRDGGWWAIDGYGDKPLKVEAWSRKVSEWSRATDQPYLSFYFTDAVKFLANSGPYSVEKMSSPYYKGFFQDLANWFQGAGED